MHFSKTYAQLLLSLPPELRNNAIEYRQLKKLINQVVIELSSLGLGPSVLQGLLQAGEASNSYLTAPNSKGKQRALDVDTTPIPNQDEGAPKAVYEFVRDGESIEPRLRLWVGATDGTTHEQAFSTSKDDASSLNSRAAIFLDNNPSTSLSKHQEAPHEAGFNEPEDEELLVISRPVQQDPGVSLLWSLQRSRRRIGGGGRGSLESNAGSTWSSTDGAEGIPVQDTTHHATSSSALSENSGNREIVIPIVSDTAFFTLLQSALQSLVTHLTIIRAEFIDNLESLARAISDTARPQSSTNRFRPHSSSTDPSTITTPLLSPFSSASIPGGFSKSHSDLYSWREIFQLYVESEVFESLSERTRGERSIQDAEERLAAFAERVSGRGLGDSRTLKLKDSRRALETFLELNVLILNLKKFQRANAEATRKILKKHAKRTALPLPPTRESNSTLSSSQIADQNEPLDIYSLIQVTSYLPHILVQAIGETLLPIIPHIDDYECLICTSIAFKPVRLSCGHLFCVRCLVKMQKRGKGHCPMCRAETVLQADRSNVDWALLNFMQDWFPVESRLKLKQNEAEAHQEELQELGLDGQKCIIC